ncbi:uncharacterized protein BT62DRAFT_890455 [Guyanagaster necrorhizus]|uniref:Endopeptidase S2P n=1 Tax=Guyanagaster necrorhizus TaxID=856835 RepID=A0A9P8AUL7_9AGAR|nr:uncharacterized protein BT62DRAFT_890455 [Guyanagaster necrorhizus MCA 3950]KAG7448191.1 hypothetical protein BT62DRAFT_890455 [Guyanagaster necrorhizus MCA 3950]
MLVLPFILLSLFWTAIHAIVRLLNSKKGSLLPTEQRSVRPSRKLGSSIHVSARYFHLKIESSTWNRYHDGLTGKLVSRRYRWTSKTLRHFYDAGVAFGVLGMLCAIGLLLWTCANLLTETFRHNFVIEVQQVAKRDIQETSHMDMGRSRGFVQAIIPGVTVPFSHITPIFLAVLLSQVVHEFGHAVSGALESVPINSVGAALTLVIPSAFVTFPSLCLETLKPSSRARIIAAGPWHNGIFWIILVFLGWMRLSYYALTLFSYEDISGLGRVVLDVEHGTALDEYLPKGSIITQLDDKPVNGTNDAWSTYLTASQPSTSKGWCVEKDIFFGETSRQSPASCCLEGVAVSLLSCFTTGSDTGCLDAVPLLTKPKESIRCDSISGCEGNSICVRPDESAQLLRISVQVTGEDDDEIILWRGPKKEVLQQVQLGTLRPRLSLFPLWLPSILFVLEGYLNMATLSLYLFNLLPLPYLDGSRFLETLLTMVSHAQVREIYDLEMGINTGSRHVSAGWTVRVERTLRAGTTVVFIMCAMMASWNSF